MRNLADKQERERAGCVDGLAQGISKHSIRKEISS